MSVAVTVHVTKTTPPTTSRPVGVGTHAPTRSSYSRGQSCGQDRQSLVCRELVHQNRERRLTRSVEHANP